MKQRSLQPLGMSRREFLIAANAAAFLLLVDSCNVNPFAGSKASPSIPAGSSPNEQALRLLRDAVRASPDHLAQRAADLVAGRDATKIMEFVRDRISVVPPWFPGDEPGTSLRWGSAATLRGGQGTLRDRADVLADMLTRAGFKAKVQSAGRPTAIGLAELYQARPVDFAPDQSRVDLARSLLAQAGASAPASPETFDAGPDPVAAVLAALPQSVQKAKLRTDLLPSAVPVVAYSDGGKTRYAYALGSLPAVDQAPAALEPAVDADPVRMVTITISALCNPAIGAATPRDQTVDLVTGSWPADQVVGRQVLLTFLPPQGPEAVLQSGLSSLPVRIPVLRVQTDVAPAEASPNLLATGSLITVQGDVLGPPSGYSNSAGPVTGPFGTMQSPSDADRAAAIARASSIRASANATAFPEIELQVAVNDSTGAPVDGLDVRSFTVKEEGAAVSALALYSNVRVQPRPRVLIVYDAYVGFAPDLFTSDASKAAFESGLAAAIVAQAAKTPFDVQVIAIGAAPDPHAWASPDAAVMAAAMAAAHESADDPWGTVGGPALDQGVNAIVLVSDMNSADTDPVRLPYFQRRVVASRVPVFTVPVGHIEQATGPQIVSMSGGASFDPADPSTPAKIAAALAPVVSSWVGDGYRIRYQAGMTGPSRRTVTVSLTGRDQPVGTAAYDVPTNPLPPPSFAGLYATITLGPLNSVRRIAGIAPAYRGAPHGALDDPVAVAETRAALNGVTTIAIEPGTPTAAALLDDVLSSMLSIEPLRPIWSKATAAQILKAVPNGVRRTPALLGPLLAAQGATSGAVAGLRVAILQERQLAASAVEGHMDLAPGLNPVIPVGSDAGAGFKAAVATSVAASIVEAATFGDSAFARLK
ncbi:MAG: hypothetical protein ACHQ0J_14050, partial [Candidatus Dormibacterales bacterium]